MLRNSVQIGPTRYRIRKFNWNDKRIAGSRAFHATNSEIGIEKGMLPDVEAECFLHELLHAIWYIYMLDKYKGKDREELIVTNMSIALCTAFIQNPWLLPYLQKGLLQR